MKILFICGCLESGKDGVGDYTRRLVCQLIELGHSCQMLALMDKFVTKANEELQCYNSISVSSLRLPYQNGFQVNLNYAQTWISNFSPDWISLQYVPFSYHSKGLPIFFSRSMNSIRKSNNSKLHVMFHELWVGMNDEASFKLKVWGYFQRLLIKSFLINIPAKLITTQTDIYKYQLEKLNFTCKLLGINSNIPVFNSLQSKKNFSDKIQILFFGQIHANSIFTFFVEELSYYLSSNSIKGEVYFIGNNGFEKNAWIESLTSNSIDFIDMGQQSQEVISKTLSKMSFGISTTPLLLIEKSGTAMAMLEHNLPIILVSKPWSVKGYNLKRTICGVYEYKKGNLQLLLSSIKSQSSIEVYTNSFCQFEKLLMKY